MVATAKAIEEIGRGLHCTTSTDETIRQMARLMGANPDFLVGGDAASTTPHIEDGKVVLDGAVLVEPRTVVERLVCLVLSFSLANLRFPRKLNAMLMYIQLYILGIDDGSRAPMKTLSFRRQIATLPI